MCMRIRTLEEVRLLIAIPTFNSSAYIYRSLDRLKSELTTLFSLARYEVALCLNGTFDNAASEREIKRFIGNNPDIPCTLHIVEQVGKNNAINFLSFYGKDNGFNVIQMLDDDTYLKEGSIVENLQVLLEKESALNLSVLVGSHFYAFEKNFQFFLDRSNSTVEAIWHWFCHSIFITPFYEDSTKSKFCIGQSICASLDMFPEIPDRVADDGFLCNYYLLINKQVYLDTGFVPILKPENSAVRFHVSSNFKEWVGQQIRIYTDVMYSYQHFGEECEFLKNFFAWAYHCDLKYPQKAIYKGAKRQFFYYLYFLSMKYVHFRASKLLHLKAESEWSTAYSTKL